ncbi:hypothetical protein BKA69DRAFT_505396 [Paraphysoderma sedebokerense]|nr:hypothetical protein BKA69DRAFT_505396 [Paraphysoderma sedebokerense]
MSYSPKRTPTKSFTSLSSGRTIALSRSALKLSPNRKSNSSIIASSRLDLSVLPDNTQNAQTEYIKQLEQKIYALEFENRFHSKDAIRRPSTADGRRLSWSPPRVEPSTGQHNDTLDNSARKHEDLEVQILKLESQLKSLEIENSTLRNENTELKDELQRVKESAAIAKEQLTGLNFKLTKKLEYGEIERKQVQEVYRRIQEEKEKLQRQISQSDMKTQKYRDQVEEQIQINGKLKLKCDDLQSKIMSLQVSRFLS